jgi:hypothetical protein
MRHVIPERVVNRQYRIERFCHDNGPVILA